MPHLSTKGRTPAAAALLILLLAALGLAACGSSGGSSSTSAQTAANAAATGTSTTGATSSTSSTSASPGTTPGGTSSTGTTPAGQPSPQRYTTVRECLLQKGITLPQRTAAGGIQLPKGMTRSQFAAALKTCNVKVGGANRPGQAGQAGQAGHPLPSRFSHVLARFAACLRQNGVNVGEPNTSGKGPIFNTKGVNTGSPQFRAAAAKCRTTLFGGLARKPSSSTGPRSASAGATSTTG